MEQGGIDPRVSYGAVVEDCRRSVRALSRKSMAVAGLRLLVFVAAFVAVVLFWHQPAKASMLFVAGMAAFLWLVKFSARISQLKDSETAKMRLVWPAFDFFAFKFDSHAIRTWAACRMDVASGADSG